MKNIEQRVKVEAAAALFQEASEMPQRFPDACFSNDALWADTSEKANSITRDVQTGTRCVAIGVQEKGQWLCYYSMREVSDAFVGSRIRAFVADLLSPESAA